MQMRIPIMISTLFSMLVVILTGGCISQSGPRSMKTRKAHREYESGRLHKAYEYYKLDLDVVLHGQEVTYYDLPKSNSGERIVKAICHWKHGKRNGVCFGMFSSGGLRIVGCYREGKKHGHWYQFDRNREIIIAQQYIDGCAYPATSGPLISP
jgi:antitoxin component YwqK of YwqJK toxin-antitoxin module